MYICSYLLMLFKEDCGLQFFSVLSNEYCIVGSFSLETKYYSKNRSLATEIKSHF